MDLTAPTLDAPPVRFFGDDSECAKYIQRKWRSRKLRRLLASFPSVEQLRSLYMDKKAEAAGAAGSKWYTGLALAAREHVRMSEEVSQCCERAWQAVMECTRIWAAAEARKKAAAEGPAAAELAAQQALAELANGLTKPAYTIMMRKLYLMSKLRDGETDFNMRDFLNTTEEDWIDDAGPDATVLDEAGFKRAWFQLIDLHTESISADDYVKWATQCLEDITVPGPDGVCTWRDDDDLMRLYGSSKGRRPGGGRRRKRRSPRDPDINSKLADYMGGQLSKRPQTLASVAAFALRAEGALAGAGSDSAGTFVRGGVTRGDDDRPRRGAELSSGDRGAWSPAGRPDSSRSVTGEIGKTRTQWAPDPWIPPNRSMTREANSSSPRPPSPPNSNSLRSLADAMRVFKAFGSRPSTAEPPSSSRREMTPLAPGMPLLGLEAVITKYDGRPAPSQPPFGLGIHAPTNLKYFDSEPIGGASTVAASLYRRHKQQHIDNEPAQGPWPRCGAGEKARVHERPPSLRQRGGRPLSISLPTSRRTSQELSDAAVYFLGLSTDGEADLNSAAAHPSAAAYAAATAAKAADTNTSRPSSREASWAAGWWDLSGAASWCTDGSRLFMPDGGTSSSAAAVRRPSSGGAMPASQHSAGVRCGGGAGGMRRATSATTYIPHRRQESPPVAAAAATPADIAPSRSVAHHTMPPPLGHPPSLLAPPASPRGEAVGPEMAATALVTMRPPRVYAVLGTTGAPSAGAQIPSGMSRSRPATSGVCVRSSSMAGTEAATATAAASIVAIPGAMPKGEAGACNPADADADDVVAVAMAAARAAAERAIERARTPHATSAPLRARIGFAPSSRPGSSPFKGGRRALTSSASTGSFAMPTGGWDAESGHVHHQQNQLLAAAAAIVSPATLSKDVTLVQLKESASVAALQRVALGGNAFPSRSQPSRLFQLRHAPASTPVSSSTTPPPLRENSRLA